MSKIFRGALLGGFRRSDVIRYLETLDARQKDDLARRERETEDARKQADQAYAELSAAREAGSIVSFDPNLRFPLWPDRDMLRGTVLQFLPLSNILKISDEELEFLTGTADIESALPQLLVGDVQLVLYTCGSSGAHAYTRTAHGFAPCRKVRAVDTTGAGDGFIGSFLWQLERDGVTRNKLEKLSKTKLNEYLAFSNQFCGISVQQHGAIDSYPTLDQMQ